MCHKFGEASGWGSVGVSVGPCSGEGLAEMEEKIRKSCDHSHRDTPLDLSNHILVSTGFVMECATS